MDKRLALIVGISAYPNAPLKNPVNDANSIADTLRGFGFDVMKATDCDITSFDRYLDDFHRKLDSYDAGLFFFAGHGVQVDGVNYLLMTDTDPRSPSSFKRTSADLDGILLGMDKSSAASSVIILDTCRNNPFPTGWDRAAPDQSLAPVFAPKGTIISYATSPGEKASDGIGSNGTYTEALLKHITEKDRPIEVIFKRVRNSVAAATNGRQTTWEHTSLSGEFYFDESVVGSVGAYSPEAIADVNFKTEKTSFAAKTLSALKSYNWYKQNPAIMALNTEIVRAMSIDEMFVIGRNILQAADGSSGSAFNFINEFEEKTRGWPEAQTRAIFDGMLFEVFFDSEGLPRKYLKSDFLDELVEYREENKATFDFIAKCQEEAGMDPIVPINQDRSVSVAIKIRQDDDRDIIDGIWIDGKDWMTSSKAEDIRIIRRPYRSASPDVLRVILANLFGVSSSQCPAPYLCTSLI